MRRRTEIFSLIGITGLLAVSLAACGSSSSSSASSSASASSDQSSKACLSATNGLLQKYEKPPTLTMPPPIPASKVKALKGKEAWFVADTLSNPLDLGIYSGFKAAAKAAGMVPKVYDAGGTTAGYNQGILEAVAQHASGIVLGEFDATDAGGSVAKAKAANIPVVGSFEPAFPTVSGYSGYVNQNYTTSGDLKAAYALAHSNCHPDIFSVTANVFTNVHTETNAIVAYTHKYCPSCNVKVQNVDVASIPADTGTDTSSALTADPKIDFMTAGFDGIALYMLPPIQAAHSKAQVISGVGAAANLKLVAEGKTQVADVMAAPDPVVGWMDFDQLLRAMTGTPQVAVWHNLPLQVVTQSNASKLLSFPGFKGYQCKFQKTWGLPCS